jgi:hypothetical protein
MNKREAVRILMLSPIYFRLSLAQRHELVEEFLQLHMRSFISLAQDRYQPSAGTERDLSIY